MDCFIFYTLYGILKFQKISGTDVTIGAVDGMAGWFAMKIRGRLSSEDIITLMNKMYYDKRR